jgi:hypothetical protein
MNQQLRRREAKGGVRSFLPLGSWEVTALTCWAASIQAGGFTRGKMHSSSPPGFSVSESHPCKICLAGALIWFSNAFLGVP